MPLRFSITLLLSIIGLAVPVWAGLDTATNTIPLSDVGTVLILGILASFVFSLPSLWTHRIWLSSKSRMFLHAASACYASLWGMWFFGGLKIFFEANLNTLLWLVSLWALFLLMSLITVPHRLGLNPFRFYLTTSISRFVVMAYYTLGFAIIIDANASISFMTWTLPFILTFLVGIYWYQRQRVAKEK